MLTKAITVRVPATFDGARDAATTVRELLDQLAIPPSQAARFELALAESLNNVAEHGGCGDDGMIDVSMTLAEGGGLSIVVTDDGPAADLDVLNTFMRRPETPDEMSEGGRGIQLIRRIMDRAVYSRENDRNVLTMSAKLDGDIL